ncbi:hypothetical protein F53441_8562 [Fusarium austroafricanum]|uniref:NACHT domain-containing protein n=1 Tax=Fusarium austroafricanum TaxID=2364996 RepID=A0A8H4KDQ8_9HYPO|nr:hypothetical protein F53441_8562 [Fusarium austroafricanum]
MLTSFEALGAASAVLQVISFAGSLIPLCYNIYDGKPTQEAQLEDYAKRLADLAGRLKARSQTMPQMTPDERLLAETAEKCINAANDLRVEANYVTRLCRKCDFSKAMHAALRATKHRNKIERLERTLQQCRQVMETELLFKLCKKGDAIQHQQNSNFGKLENDIQSLISRIAQGYTGIEDLLKNEHDATRSTIRDEGKRVRALVNNHPASESQSLPISTISNEQKRRLLNSLKAADMNQRYNDILAKADATFERTFPSSKNDSLQYLNIVNRTYDVLHENSVDAEHKRLSSVDEAWGNFTTWLQSEDNRVFWVRGKPGSGKSTLMKFFVDTERTKELLEYWRPGTKIISHFFWKIGSSSQNSLQGMLCSLLHHLLSGNDQVIHQVLTHFNITATKNSYNDWSDQELQPILLFALSMQAHPTCIFIDGLDEVSSKDGFQKVIENVNSFDQVKVCVSSRTEAPIANRLSESTSLELEDLTRPDMTAYVWNKLLIYREEGRLSKLMTKRITDILLEKAEGVFLWLVLAVNNVISGIRNDETGETIIRKLSELPGELEGLYEEMWRRLNGNNPVYRQAAVRYFRYVIEGRNLVSIVNPEGIFDGLSLGEVAIAEAFATGGDQRFPGNDLSFQELKEICQKTAEDIKVRCVGMLQLRISQNYDGFGPVSRDIVREPRFIHRTAHDFLVETEAGQRILNANDASLSIDTDVSIFRGIILLAATLRKHSPIRFVPDAALFICAKLVTKGYSKESVLRMLEILHDMYNRHILVHSWDHEAHSPSQHFISLLVQGSPFLDDFIEPLLKQQEDPISAATDVLRDIVGLKAVKENFVVSPALIKLIHKLLDLGADPHVPGLPHLVVQEHNCHTTAFGMLLIGSFGTYNWYLRLPYHKSAFHRMHKLGKLLNIMAQTCPNWQERLLLLKSLYSPLCLFQGGLHNNLGGLGDSWVTVEVNLQSLLIRALPLIPNPQLNDLANSFTDPFVRIRHLSTQSNRKTWCWRIMDQQPFAEFLTLMFSPIAFVPYQLIQLKSLARVSGNTKVTPEEEEEFLSQDTTCFK